MKVDIGKPVPWYSTSRFENWAAKKLTGRDRWELTDDDYELTSMKILDAVCDAWQSVLNATINPLRSKIGQKTDVFIDRWDTWNADFTLATVAYPLLMALEENKNGIPLVYEVDIPEHLIEQCIAESQAEYGEMDGDSVWSETAWEWVLGEMIYAMGEISLHNPGEEEIYKRYEDWQDNEANWKLLMDDMKAYNDRITNGCRLFGKYFQALWT